MLCGFPNPFSSIYSFFATLVSLPCLLGIDFAFLVGLLSWDLFLQRAGCKKRGASHLFAVMLSLGMGLN